MAALVLAAAAATAPAPGGITAEQAMANYRAKLAGPPDLRRDDCPDTPSNGIVVCANRTRPSQRLPLPDERAEAGEIVRHRGEPGPGDQGPPTGPPSKQMQTLKNLFGLLKSAVTGEDPNPN